MSSSTRSLRKPGIFTDVKNEAKWVRTETSDDGYSTAVFGSTSDDQQTTAQELEVGAGPMLRTSVSIEPQNDTAEKPAKLPPISAFGILDIRKPAEHEIRLGQVSNDCLVRISTYSTALVGSSAYPSLSSSLPQSLPSANHVSSYMLSYPQPNVQTYQQMVLPVEQHHMFPAVYERPQLHDQGLNYLASMAVGGDAVPTPLTYVPAYMTSQYPMSVPISTTQYPCRYQGCNKAFPTRSRLSRHEIVHEGQKNFQCTYPGCPKRFSRKDNMLQHYRNHSHTPQKED